MDKVFKKRRHRVAFLFMNLLMHCVILLSFYPVNLLFYHFTLKEYLISTFILLIFGELLWGLCKTFLIKSMVFKRNQINLFLKHQKAKIKVSILVAWMLIVGIVFIFSNNFIYSLYIATAPALGFYYGFYNLDVYLELLESRKNKLFFKI